MSFRPLLNKNFCLPPYYDKCIKTSAMLLLSSLKLTAHKGAGLVETCKMISKRDIHTNTILRTICGGDCKGSDSGFEMDPACKVALVTGGASGIGFAIANQLLKNRARNVAITGLDSCVGKDAVHRLNNTFGKNKAMFINANMTCLTQFEETFKTVKETYKNIDIVVNCAGILDGKHWEKEIVTNVIGTIRGSLLAYKYIGKEGSGKGGVVVNVCGVEGLAPQPSAPTFTSSQHAIVGLSTSFGDSWHVSRSGVRVVALLVGATSTDFMKDIGKRGMSPALGSELAQAMSKATKQNADACGQAAIHVIRCGKSGSLWVVDGSRLFEVTPPPWEKNRKLAAQFI